MFSGIKESLQLSAAAVVVQNLLQQQEIAGLVEVDAKGLSTRLVAQTFTQNGAVFNGKNGPKPHKVTMAAMALAQGLREFDRESDEHAASFLSLGTILLEMEQNGANYSLNGKDLAFLELATREYLQHQPATASALGD